jgi:integrase
LDGEPGSPEFIASYYSAVERSKPKPKANFRYLIDKYLDSAEFRRLRDRTKSDYKYQIDRIDPLLAEMPLSALNERSSRQAFLQWRDEIAATAPSQADKALRVVARIVSWAFDQGLIPANPLQGVRQLHKGTRRNEVWTPEQEAAFLAKAPKHVQIAFKLALWTAQRRADVLKLQWSDYDGKFIRLKQNKTGANVTIAVGPTLKSVLKEAMAERTRLEGRTKKLPETILLTTRGTAWTGMGFSAVFRKTCIDAGVHGVTFHDLRGTAVTRLAEAGASVPEIASLTGHSLRDAASVLDAYYLKRGTAMATNAVHKLEKQAKRPTKRPTAAGRLSKRAEKSS